MKMILLILLAAVSVATAQNGQSEAIQKRAAAAAHPSAASVDPFWNRPTELERMGLVIGPRPKEMTAEEVILQKNRARAAAEADHAKAVAGIQAIANNPANYRVITGQVYNVMLSQACRWMPDRTLRLFYVADAGGVVIFKESTRAVAVTNFQGVATRPDRFRVLQIGDFAYQGKRLPLFDCGVLPKPAVVTNSVAAVK